MTRISTRNVKGRSERPEPLGRPVAQPSAERLTAAIEGQLPPLVNFPTRAVYHPDAFPDTIGVHDAAILRHEEAARYGHWNDDELFPMTDQEMAEAEAFYRQLQLEDA